MKEFIRVYLFLFAIWMLSCGSPKYATSHQNVMQFEGKGDLNVGGGVGDLGLFANVGYSVTNNIGLTSNLNLFGGSYSVKGEGKQDYFWENELILYRKMEKYFFPAINLGYGFGSIYNNSNLYYTNINRVFVQPSLSYHSKYVDFSLSTRFSRVKHNVNQFNEIDRNLYGDISFDNFVNLGSVGKEPFVFIEPALSIGLHLKGIRFSYQYVYLNKFKGGNIAVYDGPHILQLDFRVNLINKK